MTGSTSCLSCPAGTFSTAGSTSCSPCQAGTFSTAGSTSCSPCPAGTFSTADGSSSCSPCPAGKFSTAAGSTSCSSCPRGKFSKAGSNTSDCPYYVYSIMGDLPYLPSALQHYSNNWDTIDYNCKSLYGQQAFVISDGTKSSGYYPGYKYKYACNVNKTFYTKEPVYDFALKRNQTTDNFPGAFFTTDLSSL